MCYVDRSSIQYVRAGVLRHSASNVSIASFPDSSAPEWEIELVHAERAWYFFSREHRQR